jgi:hypothetical protein
MDWELDWGLDWELDWDFCGQRSHLESFAASVWRATVGLKAPHRFGDEPVPAVHSLPVAQGQDVGARTAVDDEPLPVIAEEAQVRAKIFLIGNSLTWDTLPGLLAGDVQWHVDCGKSLQQLHDQPAQPCVKSSTPWPQALSEKQYDYLCVQPFTGTDLKADVAVISKWLEMQPAAVLVLHTGWSRAEDFEKSYHAPLDDAQRMVHSTAYFEKLRAELQAKFPQREIRTTGALVVLDAIWHDVQQNAAPLASFKDLYRDDIHMTTQTGRYLMHNVMRRALGQAPSAQGFQIEAAERDYLDAKLSQLPAEAHEAMP